MSNDAKIQTLILSGRHDTNISFRDIVSFLEHVGFTLRIRGDHHIFTKDGVPEILNLQPQGHLAKPYQVKQVRNLLLKYHKGVEDLEQI